MSLSFVAKNRAFERRWIVYALLRDNVQHHIEHSSPDPRVSVIHAIAGALGKDQLELDAIQLRDALLLVRQEVLTKGIEELAVSVRTRAVSTGAYPPPSSTETALVNSMEWSPPFQLQGAKTLDDVLGSFVDELLQVIGPPTEGDTVKIIDS